MASKLTKDEAGKLSDAIEYLENLIDVDSSRCAVSEEAKKAVKLYVETCIIPRLRSLESTAVKGEKRSKFTGELI